MRFTRACAHAEKHDLISIEVEGDQASLTVEGRSVLFLTDLSKEQVVRLRQQAGAALASWPDDCVAYGCTKHADPGCTVRDPSSDEDLPACAEHDQRDPREQAA